MEDAAPTHKNACKDRTVCRQDRVPELYSNVTPPTPHLKSHYPGCTATYPLCCEVQADAGGAYGTGFVTSPGREFGTEVAPKGRAVLLRALLGAKLYFGGSEEGIES